MYHRIRCHDGERDVRIQLQKAGQQGCEDMVEIRGAGVNAYAADRLLAYSYRALGLLQIRENTRRPLVVGAALRGDLELEGRAIEQPRDTSRFPARDRCADRRRGLVTCPGGRRTTAGFPNPQQP